MVSYGCRVRDCICPKIVTKHEASCTTSSKLSLELQDSSVVLNFEIQRCFDLHLARLQNKLRANRARISR